MIKVLFISHSYVPIGGAPKSLNLLVRFLPTDKCKLTVACVNKKSFEYLNRKSNTEVIYWPDPVDMFGKIITVHSKLMSYKNFSLFRKRIFQLPKSSCIQMKILKASEYDIIHLNSSTLITVLNFSLNASFKFLFRNIINKYLFYRK